jgi:hypothetical protein
MGFDYESIPTGTAFSASVLNDRLGRMAAYISDMPLEAVGAGGFRPRHFTADLITASEQCAKVGTFAGTAVYPTIELPTDGAGDQARVTLTHDTATAGSLLVETNFLVSAIHDDGHFGVGFFYVVIRAKIIRPDGVGGYTTVNVTERTLRRRWGAPGSTKDGDDCVDIACLLTPARLEALVGGGWNGETRVDQIDVMTCGALGGASALAGHNGGAAADYEIHSLYLSAVARRSGSL